MNCELYIIIIWCSFIILTKESTASSQKNTGGMHAIRSPLKQHCKQIGKCHVTFLLLNMQKTVICISHRIHHCINIKDWWRSVGSFEYWRNLFYAVRRGGRVQCRAISDLLMLNPELNLHTHKFTCRVHGESPGELCNMLSTLRSLETHIFQSPDELLKAHHPHHVFYIGWN